MGSDVPAQTNSEHIGPTLGTVGRAQAYDRHTGRYAPQLAPAFARFAGVTPGMRVREVGCDIHVDSWLARSERGQLVVRRDRSLTPASADWLAAVLEGASSRRGANQRATAHAQRWCRRRPRRPCAHSQAVRRGSHGRPRPTE